MNQKRVVICIPTIGCAWWRESRGCLHCNVGYILANHSPCESPKNLVISELEDIKYESIESLCLYTPGSILDHTEITHNDLLDIIIEVKKKISPQRIVVESRPELIKSEYLKEIAACAADALV